MPGLHLLLWSSFISIWILYFHLTNVLTHLPTFPFSLNLVSTCTNLAPHFYHFFIHFDSFDPILSVFSYFSSYALVVSCTNLASQRQQTVSSVTYVDPLYDSILISHNTITKLSWSTLMINPIIGPPLHQSD